MVVTRPTIVLLRNEGDERGESYQIGTTWRDFLTTVKDIHALTIKPGSIRGNHYHRSKSEVLIVLSHDSWTLFWDEGDPKSRHSQSQEGTQAALIMIPKGCSHAIRNDGKSEVIVFAIGDAEFDLSHPDIVSREVINFS